MKSNDEYVSIKPNNEALKNYIAYYYFNFSKGASFTKEFLFYPHYKNALTIYKNASIKFSKNISTVIPEKQTDYTIIYTGIHLQSRIGKIKAPFNKIGIVFQPLGINNFMVDMFSEVIPESPKSNFQYFGDDFNKVLDKVYYTQNIESKRKLLDAFFIKILNPIQDERINNAVTFLLNDSSTIQEVADSLRISRKTLLRLFKKHLNCTPKDFASVVKFRNALSLYQASKKELQLTSLAYENNYYDQSDFIKHFKKTTGFNPKKFFSNISHLGTEDTFWTLLK